MPPAIKTIIEAMDRAEIERAIQELRQQLEVCEQLLAVASRVVADGSGEMVVSGNIHASLSRKREAVLVIMRERPGRWSTSEIRDALAARGINPELGTPVKNVLWNLAKAGHVNAVGNGVYELAVLARSAASDHEEAMAA